MSNPSPMSRFVNGVDNPNSSTIVASSGNRGAIVSTDSLNYRGLLNVEEDEEEEEEEEDDELEEEEEEEENEHERVQVDYEEEEELDEEEDESEDYVDTIDNCEELESCDLLTTVVSNTSDYHNRDIVVSTCVDVGGVALTPGVVTASGESAATAAAAARAAYKMVAAMNEHLSSSSTTNNNSNSSTSTNSIGSSCTSSSNSDSSATNSNNLVIGPRTTGAIINHDYNDKQYRGKVTTPTGILSFPCDFDHMYASMTDGGVVPGAAAATVAANATSIVGVSPLRANEASRNNDANEIKHLKDLLLLHLDLIQQQSEQIVTKDKLLAALRQENETLKLRLERMDRRVNLQKLRSESAENSVASDHTGPCSPPNLNSVGFVGTSDQHQQQTQQQQQQQQQQQHKNPLADNTIVPYNETFKIRLNTSGGITTVKQENPDCTIKSDLKQDNDLRLDWESKKKRRSENSPLVSTGSKRKRGLSCSSSISNDTTSTIADGKSSLNDSTNRKNDKKGKSGLLKKDACLTTDEHYYTAVGDPNYSLNVKPSSPMDENNSLEVPNWRIKVYTSCYTMEGTENLDDEIFNKRHLKLENDERRRKRWDVQRIREQRHIEKLKQRQERQNHQATCYNTNHTGPCPSTTEEEIITSLWPDVEQIQNLQVDPQLPVSAFGASIPNFSSSEFSLPWLHTTRSKSRRPKRSTGRRKSRR